MLIHGNGRVVRAMTVSAIMLGFFSPVRAQFSPGPLSAAHAALEGATNCTQCHDVGREIAGSKCLGCHTEINTSRGTGGGYHSTVSARQKCVDCHKEHLGRDAKTFAFDPAKFDHDLTGFLLSGKHDRVRCGECHTAKFIRVPAVTELLKKNPHETYLGLEARCATCHDDVHKGKFGADCATCHRPSGWKEVGSFDHSRTNFSLTGKHIGMTCEKCHRSADPGGKSRFAAIPAADYADCAPCHSSPHRAGMVKKDCAGCHETAGWALAMKKPFDHTLTGYELKGGHARVACEQCHAPAAGRTFLQVFRRPFGRCVDCHADRHDGAFAASYRNDCAACHTVQGFSPSTFTFASHQKTSWPLAGAHMAVPCADCHHRNAKTASWQFRFGAAGCESCHRDVHGGQFAAEMKGCASCHESSSWKPAVFQHFTLTGYPLEGKHAAVTCEACHTEIAAGAAPATGPAAKKFRKLSTNCESCHRDRHHAQFAFEGATKCEGCHQPSAWSAVRFDHETRSAFSLKGGHADVRCAECHPRETSAGDTFIRYKPLSSKCESCHRQKELK